MPNIDVSSAFKAKDDILRKLLHKGKPNENLTLRLWGLTVNEIGGREAKVLLTSGWNHKQEKDVVTGQVTEVLKISHLSPVTADIMLAAMGCDIVFEDGSFDRYSFQGKAQFKYLTGEWKITVTPSFQDKEPLFDGIIPLTKALNISSKMPTANVGP